mmetsp:Transcript_7979/g.7174  ORF Transcript_7979/g.7174 Transcript_7979/m.7174 type:complete len:124 (+) Transcript_7979:1349-1720(+)
MIDNNAFCNLNYRSSDCMYSFNENDENKISMRLPQEDKTQFIASVAAIVKYQDKIIRTFPYETKDLVADGGKYYQDSSSFFGLVLNFTFYILLFGLGAITVYYLYKKFKNYSDSRGGGVFELP